MIVAGIGCRTDSTGEEIVGAVDAALLAHGLSRAALARLATAARKLDQAGLQDAAACLDLPLEGVGQDALEALDAATLTRSARSSRVAGVSSLSEAAALAGAGEGARLLGPRIARGGVTCALAEERAS